MKPRLVFTILFGLVTASALLAVGAAFAGAHLLDAMDVKSGRECANWPVRLKQSEAALSDPERRFFALGDAAKASFELGDGEKAAKYARELLDLAPRHRDNWNFGNAFHDAHLVLGRVALASGHVESARAELLAAGTTPGSPQLNSFGPNMSLARDLLQRGERDVVLQYFRECARFWELGRGRIKVWSLEAKLHLPPSFGANLIF